jgi:hypothetical protein
MSNLVDLHGHRSASQRREEVLQAAREHHVKVIAILVAQMGGKAIIPFASMQRGYQLKYAYNKVTGDLGFTSEPDALVVAPDGSPAEAPPASKEG